jgi:hypothetical protein
MCRNGRYRERGIKELDGFGAELFGSVNANGRHFERATRALNDSDRDWLGRLITRRGPLERWQDALEKGADDVKTIVELAG